MLGMQCCLGPCLAAVAHFTLAIIRTDMRLDVGAHPLLLHPCRLLATLHLTSSTARPEGYKEWARTLPGQQVNPCTSPAPRFMRDKATQLRPFHALPDQHTSFPQQVHHSAVPS